MVRLLLALPLLAACGADCPSFPGDACPGGCEVRELAPIDPVVRCYSKHLRRFCADPQDVVTDGERCLKQVSTGDLYRSATGFDPEAFGPDWALCDAADAAEFRGECAE